MILIVNSIQIPVINYNHQSMAELKAELFFTKDTMCKLNCVIAKNLASKCHHVVNHWCLAVCNASILVRTIWHWQNFCLDLPCSADQGKLLHSFKCELFFHVVYGLNNCVKILVIVPQILDLEGMIFAGLVRRERKKRKKGSLPN